MEPRRADLVVGAVGALLGGVLAALSVHTALDTATGVLVGAALGAARRHPAATWAAAAAIVLMAAALGGTPGGDELALDALVAAHMFCAGRWDERPSAYVGLGVLALASEISTLASGSTSVPGFSVVLAGAWGAGWVLRSRQEVAGRLAERARDLEQERDAYSQLSVRYERARIASELHDIVAHAISVMVVQAGAGQRLAEIDPDLTAEAFEAIAGSAREAQDDIARLIALLGDRAAIGPAPDLELVEELVARAAHSGLDVRLRLEGEREGLPAELVQTVYRAVQEALTNALRYSAGAAVEVRLDGRTDALVLDVTNGPATAPSTLEGAGTGNGLRGLRERVDACGGTLQAGPTADGGWHVHVRLPRRVPASGRA